MAQLLQPSFSAGEFSPKLYGRVDLVRYGVALATCRNFIVLPEGGIQNRSGTRFLAVTGGGLPDARPVRLIPFRYNTEQAYAIELGEFYARFFANGAPLRVDSPAAWSSGTTYADKAFVTYSGVVYMSRQAGNTNHIPAALTAWWIEQDVLEIATPWAGFEAFELRYTQSADIMTLTHVNYKPRQLRRLAADSFDLIEFDHREGPFANLNIDDAVVVSSSARTGAVTISSNGNIFTPDMVGQLLYMELRDLTQIKPWVVGEHTPNLAVGALRRSDGKTYQCVTIPTGAGAEWSETGSRAPVHDQGRAWDGPGDFKDNGSVQWYSGVEWEYRDSGYGIVQFTEYVGPTSMLADVKRVLPDQVVGGIGSPAASWALTGDGVTKVFAIAGATGTTREYSVTIAGVPIAADPPFSGGGGGSGGPGGDLP